MAKDDFWGFVAALVLGIAGLAILSELSGPHCPKCRQKVAQGAFVCPNCGTVLRWG